MEKRVFAAIFLSFVVLVVYQNYFAPPIPAPAATPVATTPGSPAATITPGVAGLPAAQPPGAAPVSPVPAAVELVAP